MDEQAAGHTNWVMRMEQLACDLSLDFAWKATCIPWE